MWKCEKCETINNSDKCFICGEPRPIKSSQTPNTYYNNQNQKEQQTRQSLQPDQMQQSNQVDQPHNEKSVVKKDHKLNEVVWLLGMAIIGFIVLVSYYSISTGHQSAKSAKKTNTTVDTYTTANANANANTNTSTSTNTDTNTSTNSNTDTGGQSQSSENSAPAADSDTMPADLMKWDISSSSTLANEGKLNYYPSNIADGNLSTSWVEGARGSGIGEWVMLTATNNQKLKGIKIINGYASNMEFYNKNNRVKLIRVELSDGTTVEKKLEDSGVKWQYVDFGKEVVCSSIKITILDIYRGNKYDDTCIAEIDFY